MARYGQAFKDRVVAKLLPPESADISKVSQEIGVGTNTLERWRAEALCMPEKTRTWTAAARLEAVITTAAMDANAKSAWCREKGIYVTELEAWRENAMAALDEPSQPRVSPEQSRRAQKRIKDLEREVRRKDKALAETAALLVLTKKVSAIFGENADE